MTLPETSIRGIIDNCIFHPEYKKRDSWEFSISRGRTLTIRKLPRKRLKHGGFDNRWFFIVKAIGKDKKWVGATGIGWSADVALRNGILIALSGPTGLPFLSHP